MQTDRQTNTASPVCIHFMYTVQGTHNNRSNFSYFYPDVMIFFLGFLSEEILPYLLYVHR
jgi:hypothetical protein